MDETLVLLRRGTAALGVSASDDMLEQIAVYANGDGRSAYNMLELAAVGSSGGEITPQEFAHRLQRKKPLSDKTGEDHTNLASALHHSRRSPSPSSRPPRACRTM